MVMIKTATISTLVNFGALTGDCGCNGQCGSNCGVNGNIAFDKGMLINPAITPVAMK